MTAADLTATGFQPLFEELRRATLWGPDDRRGALNYVTPEMVRVAATDVRLGRHVSMAAPIEDEPSPDNPDPARHVMTDTPRDHADPGGLHFAMDRIDLHIHGNADSHLDALCHVIYDGRMYNGVSADSIGAAGASELSVDVVRDGIVGRGVLLDIPRARRVPWLEPGDSVTPDDLLAAETQQQVRAGTGDLLFVRVGHRRRRKELGPWDASARRAGLRPDSTRFLVERRISVLGSDGNNDTAPSLYPDVAFPVHVLAINALGVHLLDYLQLDDLAEACEAAGRWSFLCVIAPLRLPTATGSPINPIAVL